jgi:hypothetical protein
MPEVRYKAFSPIETFSFLNVMNFEMIDRGGFESLHLSQLQKKMHMEHLDQYKAQLVYVQLLLLRQ